MLNQAARRAATGERTLMGRHDKKIKGLAPAAAFRGHGSSHSSHSSSSHSSCGTTTGGGGSTGGDIGTTVGV